MQGYYYTFDNLSVKLIIKCIDLGLFTLYKTVEKVICTPCKISNTTLYMQDLTVIHLKNTHKLS